MHDTSTDKHCRQALAETHQAAVHAGKGQNVVRQRLENVPLDGEVNLIAVSKATQSMIDGGRKYLGDQIVQEQVINKPGHLEFARRTEPGWQLIGLKP